MLGILEVSRSIGDGQFKAHGVICTPDVKKLTLTPNDWFVLLACDGVWKKFSVNEAIDFSIKSYEALYKSGTDLTSEQVWFQVADELASEAVKRGSGDNVSVIIVVF